VQRGADLLRRPARTLDLPAEEALARDTVAQLQATLDRVDLLHVFRKGVGIAAPQIGLPIAVILVRPPEHGASPVVLVNPRVTRTTAEVDEQYEGCLSFFDHRGLVSRPLRIQVEHVRYDGQRLVTTFEQAVARLVSHEIDHLEGRLYTDRMPAGAPLIPLAEYRQSGRPWTY
jgi:peptide deformylase